MKFVKALLVFIVIVIIGVGIGWLAGRRPTPAPAPVVADGTSTVESSAPKTVAEPAPLKMSVHVDTNEVVIPVETDADESTNIDDKISDIIGEDAEITNIVKDLLAIFPKLSNGGKLEAAEHLTNLVDDDNYTPLANILTNKDVTPEVASHLLSDLVDRPNAIKMPLLMAVARDPQNPGAKEAKDNLELILSPEDDLGTDWDKWQKAIDDWVKENPD